MKIALIGATGFVGSRVRREALYRGHRVTAIARNLSSLQEESSENLDLVTCDIMNSGALASALDGHDVVINAYNPGHISAANAHLYRDIVEGTISILKAVKQAGTPYLVFIGGAGSLWRRRGLRVADDPNFPADYSIGVPKALEHFAHEKEQSKDVPLAGRAACLILEKDHSFNWSFLSPPLFMQPGERSGRYVKADNNFPWKGDSPAGIAIEDFAVAVIDECESQANMFQHYTVTDA